MNEFQFWVMTTAVAGLAAVLAFIGKRVLDKLDSLEALMRTELRTMDVRITRIESHLWPDRIP